MASRAKLLKPHFAICHTLSLIVPFGSARKEKGEKMDCKTCGHYELYKMINSGKPFGYSGDIPCIRCVHNGKNDEYTRNTTSPNDEIAQQPTTDACGN